MSGTRVRRAIPAWICIVSVLYAGCAANRSSLPADGSRPETVCALAVIPSENLPEINVVRMGNSRVVGAIQGAGRGFQEGVVAVAQGAGGFHGGGGGGELVAVAVFVAVMLSVGTVNALIEGVKGSRVAAPYETVSDPDAATRKRIASLGIQNGFARLVEEEARKRLTIPVSGKELPAGNDAGAERILRVMHEEGVDAALRVEIVRVGFEGRVGKDQPLSLVVALRTDVVRTSDGAGIFGKTSEYRSAPIPPEEWAKDDFRRVLREVDDGVQDLARRCVDDILEAGLVPGS